MNAGARLCGVRRKDSPVIRYLCVAGVVLQFQLHRGRSVQLREVTTGAAVTAATVGLSKRQAVVRFGLGAHGRLERRRTRWLLCVRLMLLQLELLVGETKLRNGIVRFRRGFTSSIRQRYGRVSRILLLLLLLLLCLSLPPDEHMLPPLFDSSESVSLLSVCASSSCGDCCCCWCSFRFSSSCCCFSRLMREWRFLMLSSDWRSLSPASSDRRTSAVSELSISSKSSPLCSLSSIDFSNSSKCCSEMRFSASRKFDMSGGEVLALVVAAVEPPALTTVGRKGLSSGRWRIISSSSPPVNVPLRGQRLNVRPYGTAGGGVIAPEPGSSWSCVKLSNRTLSSSPLMTVRLRTNVLYPFPAPPAAPPSCSLSTIPNVLFMTACLPPPFIGVGASNVCSLIGGETMSPAVRSGPSSPPSIRGISPKVWKLRGRDISYVPPAGTRSDATAVGKWYVSFIATVAVTTVASAAVTCSLSALYGTGGCGGDTVDPSSSNEDRYDEPPTVATRTPPPPLPLSYEFCIVLTPDTFSIACRSVREMLQSFLTFPPTFGSSPAFSRQPTLLKSPLVMRLLLILSFAEYSIEFMIEQGGETSFSQLRCISSRLPVVDVARADVAMDDGVTGPPICTLPGVEPLPPPPLPSLLKLWLSRMCPALKVLLLLLLLLGLHQTVVAAVLLWPRPTPPPPPMSGKRRGVCLGHRAPQDRPPSGGKK
uniref:Uncharacterized protein n=1 Tax=Anopheles farauti TaxID=69004 RepID=A0A182QKT4_9DIPT